MRHFARLVFRGFISWSLVHFAYYGGLAPPDTAWAAIGASEFGWIPKVRLSQSELVVTGHLKKSDRQLPGHMRLGGRDARGNWHVGDFVVDRCIKGECPAKSVQVESFIPLDMREFWDFPEHCEVIPTGKRCMLFLKQSERHKGVYS